MNDPEIIPKVIHRIWFGSKPLPDATVAYLNTQERVCKEYDQIIWTDNNVPSIYCAMLKTSVTMLNDSRLNPVVKSDVLRYELLRLFGGIYVDTDIEILRHFDECLSMGFVCADEGMGNVGTAVLGSVPYHPINRAMLDAIAKEYAAYGPPKNAHQQMYFGGPCLFTATLKLFAVDVLPKLLLYPVYQPKLPATIHLFNGGETATGWTINMARRPQ